MIIVEDHEAREVQPSKRTERQVRVIREIAGDLMENVFQIPHSLRIYLVTNVKTLCVIGVW